MSKPFMMQGIKCGYRLDYWIKYKKIGLALFNWTPSKDWVLFYSVGSRGRGIVLVLM